jgi:hypothetical protein
MIKKTLIILAVIVTLLLVATAVFADEGFYPWQDHAAPYDFLFGNLIDNHQQSKLAGRDMLQGFIYIQFTGEEKEGAPVAVRADCENPELDCRVGWKFKAIPISAELVSTKPRVWLVDESQLPAGPQYLHFHWSGAEDDEVNNPQKPCGLVIGHEYDGYLMQRVAVTSFFWLGGNPEKGGGGGPGGPGGHDEGGCGGHDDGGHDPGSPGDTGPPPDTGSPGGPGGHEGGGCSGHEGDSCGGDEDDGGHDEGGCGGHDDGGGHDGGPGGPGEPGSHGGRLVTPGMDYHSNIVTKWDPDNDGGHGGNCGGHDDGGHDDGGHESMFVQAVSILNKNPKGFVKPPVGNITK